jgi:lysophospholipase L1-like esterase
MKKSILFLFTLFVFQFSFSQTFIKPNHQALIYSGRVNMNADSASFYWPGTSVSINFKGTGLNAVLKSTNEPAYYYVIVDDSVTTKIEIPVGNASTSFTLASGLTQKSHHLQLFKLSNNTSVNQFYGFEIPSDSKILKASELPKRKIEFYGNSITAGHGVDVPDGEKDNGVPFYFNNYYAYSALTARHFNAQYSCIARSGIGVMVSWFPEIMPEIYDRINPSDENSKWDFSNYTPDIVVVNLFQNDAWIVNSPSNEQFKRRFGTQKPTEEFIVNAYKDFITSIRSKYPKANIICALGNMDATKTGSKWPSYIKEAILRLDDPRIYSLFFPYKNTPGHPKRDDQQAMANQLIQFIEKHIKW